ncbi:MAG: hypothetical protein GXO83_03825 [Chlorobi bacterium]|nr:hypothetical protein [Chlorobiota bacterium]
MAGPHKISANYIFTGNGRLLKNGIIVLDENLEISEVIDTSGNLNESAGLEFYNGLIIPGWTPVFHGDTTQDKPCPVKTVDQGMLVLSGCQTLISLYEDDINIINPPENPGLFRVIFHKTPIPFNHGKKENTRTGKMPVKASLYTGVTGNILLISVTEDMKENVFHRISELSTIYRAGIVYSGSPETLHRIAKTDILPRGYFLIPVESLCFENKYSLLNKIHKHRICVCFRQESFPKTGKLTEGLMSILAKMPGLSFTDILYWLTINPVRAFRIKTKTGMIFPGYKPGLTLIRPFDFAKMTILPESRFYKIL